MILGSAQTREGLSYDFLQEIVEYQFTIGGSPPADGERGRIVRGLVPQDRGGV